MQVRDTSALLCLLGACGGSPSPSEEGAPFPEVSAPNPTPKRSIHIDPSPEAGHLVALARTGPNDTIKLVSLSGDRSIALPASVKRVLPFSEGLARFQGADERWGYLNTDGEIVVEPVYSATSDYKCGFIRAIRDPWSDWLIFRPGEEPAFRGPSVLNHINVSTPIFSEGCLLNIGLGRTRSLLDPAGRPILEGMAWIGDFSEGWAVIRDLENRYTLADK